MLRKNLAESQQIAALLRAVWSRNTENIGAIAAA